MQIILDGFDDKHIEYDIEKKNVKNCINSKNIQIVCQIRWHLENSININGFSKTNSQEPVQR